jgi:hypothetical protein
MNGLGWHLGNPYQRSPIPLKPPPPPPISFHMVNPISSTHASQLSEAAKPAATPKPQPQQKTSPQPSDTVKLKSAGGDVDHDADSK